MTSFSMGTGLIAELSQAISSGDRERRRQLLSTAFSLQILLNGFMVGLGILCSRLLAPLFFGEGGSVAFLLPVILALPFLSVKHSYILPILYAHGKYNRFSNATMLYAVVELLFIAAGAWKFGIVGAFWGLFSASVAWFLLMLYQTRDLEPLGDVLRFGIHRSCVPHLVKSGGVMLCTGLMTYGSGLLVRAWITTRLGADHNGYYQVLLVFSACYLPFLTNGIWARLFPKISAHGLDSETVGEWSDTLTLIATLGAAAQIGILIHPRLFISLFYTPSFQTAASALPLQLLGDYFFLIAQPALGVLQGLKRIRTFFIISITSYAVLCASTWLLLPKFGLAGVSLGYLAGNIVMAGQGLMMFIAAADGERTRRLMTSLAGSLAVVILQALLFWQVQAVWPRVLVCIAWGCYLLILFRSLDRLTQRREPIPSYSVS